MNQLKNKHWIGICKKPEEEEDRNKPGKGPFWRKQENAAKDGGREVGRKQGQMVMLHKCSMFPLIVKNFLLPQPELK
jgi:hypothetical protein